MSKINDVQKIIWRMKNESGKAEQDLSSVLSSISNPNILMNGEFKVNQRGGSGEISTLGYSIADRWKLESGTYERLSAGIKLNKNSKISQWIEGFDLFGKTITISVKTDEKIFAETIVFSATSGTTQTTNFLINDNFYAGLTFNGSYVTFFLNSNINNLHIYYIKLEVGEIATKYSPKNFIEELLECQRYYIKIQGGRYAGITIQNNAWIFIPLPVQIYSSTAKINISSPGNVHCLDAYYPPNSISWFSVKNNGIDMEINLNYSFPELPQVAVWEDMQIEIEAEQN